MGEGEEMKISVTRQDIRLGFNHPCFSPVALAVSRALIKTNLEISECIYLEGQIIENLPEEAREFLRRFNSNEAVGPFTFEVAD